MVTRRLALPCALLLLSLIVSCSSGSSGDPAKPVISGGGTVPASTGLYIVQPGDSAFLPATPAYVLAYPETATGSPTPAAEITSPDQVLFDQVALDSSGLLYVSAFPTSSTTGEIVTYSSGSTGSATSSTYLTVPASGSFGFVFCLDPAGNVYVTYGQTINVYAAGKTAGAPIRSIQAPTIVLGDPTVLDDAKAIAADAAGNIYVINSSVLSNEEPILLIYSAAASGKIFPTATLSGSNTGIHGLTAITLDSAGSLYVAINDPVSQRGSILVFAPGATGNVAPVRTIAGSNTSLDSVGELQVNSAGTLFVTSIPLAANVQIVTFPPGASGNVAPLTTLTPHPLPEITAGFGAFAVK